MGVLQSLFVVVSGAALLAWVLHVRRMRGLGRRLLLIVSASALVPAAGSVLVTVQAAREMLGVLDAPGVRAAMDGGLGLARAVLEREQAVLAAWADSLARSDDPRAVSLPGGTSWQRRDAERGTVGSGGVPLGDADAFGAVEVDARPRRVEAEGAVHLVCARVAHDGSVLVVSRVLPEAIARDLERVEEGSQGLRQLGLYYREVLGTYVLVVAAGAVLLVALLSGWAGRVASDRLVVPLVDLVEATRRVATGDLGHRVPVRGAAEVRELAEAFNAMTERLDASERRRLRSERLAAWQSIARRLAHEIKNPLTPIQLALHRLRRPQSETVAHEALDAIEQETQNLQRLAEEFSALGRLPEPQPRPVRVRRVLEEVVALYVPETVTVVWDGEGDPFVHADPGQLRQVTSNLVKNAVEAMARRGTLHLRLEEPSEGLARWAVRDDGPGLPSPRELVFEPGFTTRATGSGLGLAIAQRIAEDHGATITAEDAPGGGACLRLQWPVAADPNERSTT